MRYVVGIDLGGTHVSAAVVSQDGTILGHARRDVDRTRTAAHVIRKDVLGAVRAAVKHAGVQPAAVGIGVPGSVDRAAGRCYRVPNFGWRDEPLAALMRRACGLPTVLLNDVHAQTLGEYHFGGARGHRSFLMVSLGTGVGGGLMLDGRLIEGAHGSAGEIGHSTVDPEGAPCSCGSRGCLETKASGPAIARAAAALGLASQDASMVAAAALAGDPAAQEVLATAGRWLGIALANVMGIFDPERILVGGGVAQAGDLLLRPAREEAAKRARMLPGGTPPIERSTLGEQAGILGAAAHALQSLG